MKILLFLACLLLSGQNRADPFLPEGYLSAEFYNDPDPWMDWTDYEVFHYPANSASLFSEYNCYAPVSAQALPALRQLADDFAHWADLCPHLQGVYDFDPACMDDQDYYLLDDDRPDSEHYALYYFDTQTDTLYFFDCKW